jgi:hypothetical protein
MIFFLAAANHRFFIHFGEDHCRLSSDQTILETIRRESVVLAIISNTLLFGFPNWYQARFEGLWIDQLAYTSHWRKHVSETSKDLKQMMSSVCLMATFVGSVLTISSRCLHFLCESPSLHRRAWLTFRHQSKYSYDPKFLSPCSDLFIIVNLHLRLGHNICPLARTAETSRHERWRCSESSSTLL